MGVDKTAQYPTRAGVDLSLNNGLIRLRRYGSVRPCPFLHAIQPLPTHPPYLTVHPLMRSDMQRWLIAHYTVTNEYIFDPF
ncbi:Hypothetical protein NTJ_03714 [Nesidiocoris tenuis]|uniref:Uncharacterized protein n=1 Tax=Nesidiocoris tenuis TaxID=355587 RepID=A0ABN7AF44_9HEMI|nr:Hypothetical protein NTJ_03714 [Nesidiocoris tenuis]